MKKSIGELLKNVPYELCLGSKVLEIDAVSLSSKNVTPTTLFIAQEGEIFDGHDFIDKIITTGIRAIVCEVLPKNIDDKVTYILVTNTHFAAGLIASWFYGFPSKQLIVIGVTGTNGKTTVATLLWQAFRSQGHKTGLLSTVSYWINDKEFPSTHTTPDALSLHKLFRTMLDAGCSHVVMEVSSHAIAQERIAGISFKAGIFTNLTQDHLDFHKTMEVYRDTKKRFFTSLRTNSVAITNTDDEHGLYMISDTEAKKVTYGIGSSNTYSATNRRLSTSGTTFDIERFTITTQLIGEFNLLNSLAVYATLRELGYDKEIVVSLFKKLLPPPGRFEVLRGPENRVGVVDYAHTPDGLEKLLTTIQAMKNSDTSVIAVFGCGGNRDTTKRPLMGAIAAVHADHSIITSDNPRKEVPEEICADITKGITDTSVHYEIIVDRKAAIMHAVNISKPGDTIVVAGKGHENYQIIGDQKNHFSDREVLTEAFAMQVDL